ncbi:MAG: L,D-transpeptidase [Nannocystaceae bacterium]|nr:L,D-transpeptidase [Nannocystaceae bacterium]
MLDARGTGTALERALLARGQPPEAPLELRRATRAMMIYAEPRLGAKFRGKLPHGESFAVFEHVGGDAECARGAWGRIGISAFVCLEHTVRHERKPIELPRLARGQLTPYYYARVKRKDANGEHPHAPRWRSRGAMIAGAEPVDVLVPDHDYAFEYRRPSPKGTILVDGSQRVVREADVRRLEPSAFAGHDAVATPLPGDTRLAWSIVWPHASIRSDRNAEAAVVGRVPLQAEIFVDDELVRRRGIDWITVPAGADGRGGGYVDASEIRRWFPALRPAGVGDEELWIDVELEQQTLAVMLGDAPLFVTMIASGNHKHPTPQGVYRIKTKMATSTMDSQPGDDEAYSVESVPWAQFFYKRYGLHGTFWHNRFGRRTSHGCVNLSARDAALVYAMTTPDPLPGWAMSFEHRDELGTVVRVRKLDAEVPDRRERVEDEATEESPRLE